MGGGAGSLYLVAYKIEGGPGLLSFEGGQALCLWQPTRRQARTVKACMHGSLREADRKPDLVARSALTCSAKSSRMISSRISSISFAALSMCSAMPAFSTAAAAASVAALSATAAALSAAAFAAELADAAAAEAAAVAAELAA